MKRAFSLLLALLLCLPAAGAAAADTRPARIELVPVAGRLYLEVGQEATVPLYILPEGAVSGEVPVQWTIDPDSVAAITASGPDGCTVKALAPGEASLQVSTPEPVNGRKLWDEVRLSVYPKGGRPEAETVYASAVSVEINVDQQVRVHTYVWPEIADQSVTFDVVNTNVATVDENGWVTGHSVGNTQVFVYASNGQYGAFQVMVSPSQGYKYSQVKEVPPEDYRFAAADWAAGLYLRIPDREGYMGLEEACTRLELVTYLWKLMGKQVIRAVPANPFTDLEGEAFENQDRTAAMWALEKGVTTGLTAHTFGPNETVTRSQAVTFLYRAMGSPKVDNAAGFTDVPEGSWFADAAAWAVASGVAAGTGEGTFSPDQPCTRGEIYLFLYRLFNR